MRRLDGLAELDSTSATTVRLKAAIAVGAVLLLCGAALIAEPATSASGAEITISLPGGVPLTLVRIPPGSFLMGSPEDELGRSPDEGPQHRVTLTRAFYMGRYEVTQRQWEAVMGVNPASGSGMGPEYPVNQISILDIGGPDGFLQRLNQHLEATGQLTGTQLRLPTEAEWEYAARAGTAARFSFGDGTACGASCDFCEAMDRHAVWCGNDSGGSEPVGARLANGFGLFDMHGNLWEWTATWVAPYPDTPQVDPTGPQGGELKVARGGSFGFSAAKQRSAVRLTEHHTNCRNETIGFRVVATAPEQPLTFDLAIPAVARVRGSGAFFTSRVELLNAGDADARIEVEYTPRRDIGGEGRSTTVTVPAGVLVEVDDPLAQWFDFTDSEPAAGSLLLRVIEGSPAALMAQSTVFAQLEDGSSYGQLLPAQAPSSALVAGEAAYVVTTDDPSHNRVNCGVVALDDVTDVTVTAVDPMGTALAAGRRFHLDRGESVQLNDVHTRMGLDEVADFLLEVRVDRGCALAYGSVLDGVGALSAYPGTSDPTTVLPVLRGMPEVTLLTLGSIQGYDEFSGSGCITSHADSATTIEASFFERNVPGASRTATVVVEGGRSIGYRDLVGSLFGAQGVVGTVVLRSTDGTLISAVGREFSILRAENGDVTGTAGQLISGLDDGDILQPGETYHVLGLRQKQSPEGLERSHLAAFNPGSSPAELVVEAFDASTGDLEGTARLKVRGEELVQRSNVLQWVNPSQDGTLKRLQLSVTAPLFVQAFRVNRNGDPVTLDPIRATTAP